MLLTRICIGGFTNIDKVSVTLDDINALIAPNGYGKSNVMKAINFGTEFITATPSARKLMMRNDTFLPINLHCYQQPFCFEIEGKTDLDGEQILFSYSYEFSWQSATITRETLLIKSEGDQRFRSLILRQDPTKTLYLPSASQRCNKTLQTDGDTLSISQREIFGKLFYGTLVESIATLQIPRLESMENPDHYFSTDRRQTIDFLSGLTINEYIYRLMTDRPDDYALLKDGIMSLNRNIESFTPVEVRVGEGLDSTLYDIRIKELNSAHETSISRLSAGSKRIIFLFTIALTANLRQLPLILIEEPENSVHPQLMDNLLLLIRGYADQTRILLTSHSPYLMRYLKINDLWFGLPNDYGLAKFAQLKQKKQKQIFRNASALEITPGEYMFDLVLGISDDPQRIEELFGV